MVGLGEIEGEVVVLEGGFVGRRVRVGAGVLDAEAAVGALVDCACSCLRDSNVNDLVALCR